MRILQAFIFLTLYASGAPLLLSTVIEVFKLVKDVGTISKLVELGFTYHREGVLLKEMEKTNMHIDKLSTQMDSLGLHTISAVMKNLPNDIRLELKVNDLLNYITRINIAHRRMGNYLKNESGFEQSTLEDFAKSVLSHNPDSVQNMLEQTHVYLVPIDIGIADTSLLSVLSHQMEENGNVSCQLNASPQQVIMNLYNAISVTELKGYAMIQFSYMILKMFNKGNFTNEMQVMEEAYKERTGLSFEAVTAALKTTSRKFWKCDPKTFTKDKNYLEVTELLQGYLQNEVDMNPKETCMETCSYYSYARNYGCFENQYCNKQRSCRGRILNCKYIDSDMWVCPNNKSPNKRYNYIEYENGKVLGKRQTCSTTKVDSWWRWIFWHCSYCLCICDEQGTNSDRYFNLRKSVSDIKDNMIVTGIRFAKKNRIIHIQIQQGKLMPNGAVDAQTVRWLPVEDYKISDRYIYFGQDYHTLTWENRGIDFDDLDGHRNELLTGIRFKVLGSRLNLEVQLTPFDFKTGMLHAERSMWKDNVDSKRKKLNLEDKDIPTNTLGHSMPDSNPGEYTEFTHTSLEADVAQTTIPFLDSQPVATTVPMPLSGAGLYHKGFTNFGGFIGLSVSTFEFASFLNEIKEDVPPVQ